MSLIKIKTKEKESLKILKTVKTFFIKKKNKIIKIKK